MFWVKASNVEELKSLFETVVQDEEDLQDSLEDPISNLDVMVDSVKNVPPYIDLLVLISIILILWFILVVFN